MSDPYDLAGDDEQQDAKQERSASGDPIYRYDKPISEDFEPAVGDEELIDALGEHLAKTFGNGDEHSVFHEIVSDGVHLDLHIVPPNDVYEGYTLVTSGMAQRPMSPPPEVVQEIGDCRYAELVTLLPPDWPLFDKVKDYGSVADMPDEAYWPIGWMKFLARFPHEYGAWMWAFHTIPNGDPPEAFPGTGFIGSMLLPAVHLDNFNTFQAGDRTVHLLLNIPLYQEEMDLKLAQGGQAVVDGFAERELELWIDPKRPNVAGGKKKKRGWWPF